jgi:hypothetical protein
MQGLEGLLGTDVSRQQKIADGLAFRNDLILALFVAFLLQAAYAFLVSRYELTPQARRGLGLLVAGGAVLAVIAFAVAFVSGLGGVGQAARAIFSNPDQTGNLGQRLVSVGIGYREDYWRVAWDAWKERPLTGTGAGTFQYTWLEDRPNLRGVKQVHNLYLEQGTETGVFAFLALLGFVAVLLGHAGRAAWRSDPRGAPAPAGRARLHARDLPGLLGVRVALVHARLDAVLLYPRRRGREGRLEDGPAPATDTVRPANGEDPRA